MFAIIESGGKQLRVEKDAVIYVEKIDKNEGDKVSFDKVLFTDKEIGKPYIDGAKVEGIVEKQGRARKITVLRYRAKSNLRRKQGHRQPYTRVKITDIIVK